MIVIAVDIGVTGAVAVLDHTGVRGLVDMPVLAVPGKRMVKRRIDARGLLAIVRQYIPAGESGLALLEDVHMGHTPGGAGRASLMHSRGVVETVLELARLQVVPVAPQTWQRKLGVLGSGKGGALTKARELFPAVGAQLKRAKDHNRADALLLARFGLEALA